MPDLGNLGPVLAPADVSPGAWACALGPERRPLVLAPADDGGWFGGTSLVALDAVTGRAEGTTALALAGGRLDAALAGADATISAALLPYDGEALVARFPRGLVLTAEGWRPWGDWSGVPVPAPPPEPALPHPAAPLAGGLAADADARSYHAAVREMAELVRRGDVYLANLTYRLRGRALLPPGEAFAALAARAAAPMAACWLGPGRSLLSASPERFVRIRGGVAEIAPMKGTRPRGDGVDEDRALAEGLAADAKERAEHIMVVDLERNDLGRVSRAGGVSVDALLAVTATPYCHQMTSLVRGLLREDVGAEELLRATFPCGSVTGTPKHAAMRTIASLEPSPRGAYCGTLAVAVRGELDSSVLIRTAVDEGGTVTYGTGAGITIDSRPAEEYLETLLKAAPLLGDGRPPAALRETCLAVGGRVPLWPRHAARLALGGCGPTILRSCDRAMAEALGADPAATRVTVTVRPDGRVDAEARCHASSLDVPGGPRLVLAPARHAPAAAAGAKAAFLPPEWVAARERDLREGTQTAFVLDGRVLDGATASVWAVVGGTLVTPPAPPAVAGVARGLLLDHASALGLVTEVRPLGPADLDLAEEVFFTNAVGGAVAARGLGGTSVARAAALFDTIRAEGREPAS